MRKFILSAAIMLLLLLPLSQAYEDSNAQYITQYIFSGGGNRTNNTSYDTSNAMTQILTNDTNTSEYRTQEGIYYFIYTYSKPYFWKIMLTITFLGLIIFFVYFKEEVERTHWPIKILLFMGALLICLIGISMSIELATTTTTTLNTLYQIFLGLFILITFYILILFIITILNSFQQKKSEEIENI